MHCGGFAAFLLAVEAWFLLPAAAAAAAAQAVHVAIEAPAEMTRGTTRGMPLSTREQPPAAYTKVIKYNCVADAGYYMALEQFTALVYGRLESAQVRA